MEEIIKITDRNGKKAVNARELHSFLEVGKDFSSWIKERISKYDFVENQDFEVFTNIGENPLGGRPTIEYALSIDMAKELSMVEDNKKGKQARRYFIECEKAVTKQTSLLKDKAEAGMIWVKGCKEILNLNESSTLALMQKVAEPLGLPTPDYTSSKGILKSARELLKERNSCLSSQAFNKLAIKEGFLEEKTRMSFNHKNKIFKSITKKGEMFGENQVCPNNPKETQPSWYEDKFDELLKILLGDI